MMADLERSGKRHILEHPIFAPISLPIGLIGIRFDRQIREEFVGRMAELVSETGHDTWVRRTFWVMDRSSRRSANEAIDRALLEHAERTSGGRIRAFPAVQNLERS
jgi:hypothetical protein